MSVNSSSKQRRSTASMVTSFQGSRTDSLASAFSTAVAEIGCSVLSN
jgi:hypothetical protein